MASDTALSPVQAAIVTLLKADATLTGLLGDGQNGVLDYVSQTATYPYVSIDANEVPWNTFGTQGNEVDVTIHVWDQSAGWKQSQSIVSSLLRLLDSPPAAALAVSGWTKVPRCRYLGSLELRDPDGITRHIPVRFRINLEP